MNYETIKMVNKYKQQTDTSQNDANGVVLKSLLLTLNIFHFLI